MSTDLLVPGTKVFAVASHVVYGYVGNKMATLIMQSLGCEVSALNTVQFSNHTAYKQFKGTKASAEEITEIYQGLKQSYLDDFDMMLSGYIPGAAAVKAVGVIGRDLKFKATMKPGSFFWVLDPVMGDEGRLYVDEDVVPAYKLLLQDADLIVPNQFEAEVLSSTSITDLPSLKAAITHLHTAHRLPHMIITSVRLPSSSSHISVIGSSARAGGTPRLFQIAVPALDAFFSGTGDMFASLVLVRFREACARAGLLGVKSWVSPDEVEATDLPLAQAVERVLSSMQSVLERTKAEADTVLAQMKPVLEREEGSQKRIHLRKTKALEVHVVGNIELLREPEMRFRAEPVE